MLEIRRKTAIICAKIVSKIIQGLTSKTGNTFPGCVARLIYPDILPYMAKQIRKKIIVVIGTNGKTTVNSILCHMLRTEGKKVLTNHTGANMLNGVVSAFVLATGKKGDYDADYACIEVDEFAAGQILPMLKPDYILLTNIFRDQIDRYGDVDTVCKRLIAAISDVPDARLIINCDDCLSYALALQTSASITTYGINEQIFDSVSDSEVRENIFCSFCGEKLIYTFFHYGQLGLYHCPRCGWKRPLPDYTAENISFQNKSFSFDIDGTHIDSLASAPYSIYNTLSAYTALKAAGILLYNFKKAAETFDYGNNREGTFSIRGSEVHLYLAKNPVGFQQKISLILKDSRSKDILIQINDTRQDGEDISWLWGIDFNHLKHAGAETIVSTGTRRLDMALRLKYEDISCDSVKDTQTAVEKLLADGTGNLYIIVNYSGLFHTNHLLHRLQNLDDRRDKTGNV